MNQEVLAFRLKKSGTVLYTSMVRRGITKGMTPEDQIAMLGRLLQDLLVRWMKKSG